MKSIPDALRATWNAQEHNLPDIQRYDPLVCQCCDYRKSKPSDPECVCDGLDWHMRPGGGVECSGHKMLRAFGDGKKTFLMGGLK